MRTDRQLAEQSEHVFYEMAMLIGIPKKLDSTYDDITKNALLESFVIHARQLVDFFYDHRQKDDGIVSSDFFDDPVREWRKVRGKEENHLKELVKRAGEEIAHLTLTRVQPKKDWNFVRIANEIEQRCDTFLKCVRRNRISEPDKVRFQQLRQEHKEWLATRVRGVGPLSSGFMTGKTCPPDKV